MKIIKSVRIDKPSADVWQVVGEEFDQAYVWMSFVKHSFAIDNPKMPSTSPMGGRVCRFGETENSAYAEEEIINYDPVSRTISFIVYPKNTPALLPVRSNEVSIQVKSINPNQCEVIWTSSPDIKALGLILSPLLKFGLGKSFQIILKELKAYSENRDFQLTSPIDQRNNIQMT